MEVRRAKVNQEEAQVAKNICQTGEFHCDEGSVSYDHSVSGERDQGSVTLRGNLPFTVSLFAWSLFHSILFFKLRGRDIVGLEEENNKARNRRDTTHPISSLRTSDRHCLLVFSRADNHPA